MHDTSLLSGSLFGKVYGKEGMKILDVGGQDINGSLRKPLKDLIKMDYISLDIENGPGVDIIMEPGSSFPFPDGHFDLIVSTSCFEHDPCFWMTFREMCRVTKKGGYIYVSAPSNSSYHGHPGDNWRFYSDAGQALAYWSGKILDGQSYPAKVEESFHILPISDIWIDFVCIWKRVDEKEEEIVLPLETKFRNGPLRAALHSLQVRTQSIIYQQ
jgi:SAM-dependent methyltransferase